MIEGLGVPYRDTRADELSWVLGLPAQPAHAVLVVAAGRLAVELRVLGASHQVLLRRQDVDRAPVELSETVACLTGWPPGLPGSIDSNRGDVDYHFATEVRRHAGAAQFDADVAALLEQYAGDPNALIGRFPGHPLAVTVLAASGGPDGGSGDPADPGDDAACWSTWHAYPAQSEIVRTDTTVRVRTSRSER